jgi:hypothetical protein
VSLSFRDEPQANQGTISRDWGILPNTAVSIVDPENRTGV